MDETPFGKLFEKIAIVAAILLALIGILGGK